MTFFLGRMSFRAKHHCAAVVVIILASAVASRAQDYGMGYSLETERPIPVAGTTHELRVSSDLHSNLIWFTPSQFDFPTKDHVLNMVDRAAQYWSSETRMSVAVALNHTTITNRTLPCFPDAEGGGTCFPYNDGYNHTIFMSRPTWKNPGIVATAYCNWNPLPPLNAPPAPGAVAECDIAIYTNPTWKSTGGSPNGAGVTTDTPFERTYAHELGHMLGLNHPATCTNNYTGPMMCQLAGSIGNQAFDTPATGDIDGVRGTMGTTSRPTRVVSMVPNSAGVLAISANEPFTTQPPASVVRPRIACRNSTSAPDCVMTTTTEGGCTDGNCLWLTALTATGAGQWDVSAPVLIAGKNRHQADVAFAPNGRIAVVTNPQSNFPTYHFYEATTTGIEWRSSGQFAVPDRTRTVPRITWHNTLSRFVALVMDPQRLPYVFVSSASTPYTWSSGLSMSFADSAGRRPYGHAELLCPDHQVTDTQCRLLMVDNADYQTFGGIFPTLRTKNRDLKITSCRFSITANPSVAITPATCNQSERHAVQLMGLADYGQFPPTGAMQGPAWLTTTSRRNPLADFNTGILFSDSSSSTFVAGEKDVRTVNIPIGSSPKSLWGGIDCSYCRFTRTFVCMQFAGGVQW